MPARYFLAARCASRGKNELLLEKCQQRRKRLPTFPSYWTRSPLREGQGFLPSRPTCPQRDVNGAYRDAGVQF